MLARMRRWSALALLAAVFLCGCGGSGARSTGAASTTAASSTAASTTAASTTAASTTAASTAAASTTAASTTAARTQDSDVRLPARFIIRPGDTLFPPQIAAPKQVTVALTVVSGDGRRHRFVLRTPRRHQISVSPGHSAELTLKGLASGTYNVQVDGALRGRLIIGVAPGP